MKTFKATLKSTAAVTTLMVYVNDVYLTTKSIGEALQIAACLNLKSRYVISSELEKDRLILMDNGKILKIISYDRTTKKGRGYEVSIEKHVSNVIEIFSENDVFSTFDLNWLEGTEKQTAIKAPEFEKLSFEYE